MSTIANIYQSKWVTLLAAGGLAFVGYAIYFDKKRRLDPNYKQKIRQNRKAKQISASNASSNSIDFPDPRDIQSCEQFFFQQISIGEEHLQAGDTVTGIFHLSNAVVSCSQPAELLSVLQQTIPQTHFQMLIQSIPEAKMRQQASFKNNPALRTSPQIEEVTGQDDGENETPKKVFMIDDELE